MYSNLFENESKRLVAIMVTHTTKLSFSYLIQERKFVTSFIFELKSLVINFNFHSGVLLMENYYYYLLQGKCYNILVKIKLNILIYKFIKEMLSLIARKLTSVLHGC